MRSLTLNSRAAQRDGIWAWDSEHKEPILIFPMVLALLSDNPMHSEFACHIGLRGKFFCRSCLVKGSDAEDAGTILQDDNGAGSPLNSPAPSSAGSEVEVNTIPTNTPDGTASESNEVPPDNSSTQPSTSRKRKKK
jgi:hypothetical protein